MHSSPDSRRSVRTALPFPVSRTSHVCPASVLSDAACLDTLCRVTVPTVSPRKRISPRPTFPVPESDEEYLQAIRYGLEHRPL
jgi:hypothetical protein